MSLSETVHLTTVAANRLAAQISLYSDSLCINIAGPHLSFVTWEGGHCVKVM